MINISECTFYKLVETKMIEELQEQKDPFRKVRRFLYQNDAPENREWIAQLAYRNKTNWHYSIPLSEVITYIRVTKLYDPLYEEARIAWSN